MNKNMVAIVNNRKHKQIREKCTETVGRQFILDKLSLKKTASEIIFVRIIFKVFLKNKFKQFNFLSILFYINLFRVISKINFGHYYFHY